MRYHLIILISVLPVLAAISLDGLVKPLSPRWDDIHVKHSWNAVQENWGSLRRPPDGTTIDLHVSPRPDPENASVPALAV